MTLPLLIALSSAEPSVASPGDNDSPAFVAGSSYVHRRRLLTPFIPQRGSLSFSWTPFAVVHSGRLGTLSLVGSRAGLADPCDGPSTQCYPLREAAFALQWQPRRWTLAFFVGLILQSTGSLAGFGQAQRRAHAIPFAGLQIPLGRVAR